MFLTFAFKLTVQGTLKSLLQHHSSKASILQCSAFFQRRQWHPTPVLLPGESHGWRSLVGCSPWGRYESDATERLHFHFSLSRNGERNGNPLQCSCLENPRDGRAWAAIYGVAQSQTWLKRLTSSSSVYWVLTACSKYLYISSHLILKMSFYSIYYYYYPQFTKEKTESKSGYRIWLTLHR